MTPATRPLTLAELLLKFGIALEQGDRLAAEEARRDLAARFGVTLRMPRRGHARNPAGPRKEAR